MHGTRNVLRGNQIIYCEFPEGFLPEYRFEYFRYLDDRFRSQSHHSSSHIGNSLGWPTTPCGRSPRLGQHLWPPGLGAGPIIRPRAPTGWRGSSPAAFPPPSAMTPLIDLRSLGEGISKGIGRGGGQPVAFWPSPWVKKAHHNPHVRWNSPLDPPPPWGSLRKALTGCTHRRGSTTGRWSASSARSPSTSWRRATAGDSAGLTVVPIFEPVGFLKRHFSSRSFLCKVSQSLHFFAVLLSLAEYDNEFKLTHFF